MQGPGLAALVLAPLLLGAACTYDYLGADPQEFDVTVRVPGAIVRDYTAEAPGLLVLRYEFGDHVDERHLTVLCGERNKGLRYQELLVPTNLDCAGYGTIEAWIEPLDPSDAPSCGDDFDDAYAEHPDGPPDDAPEDGRSPRDCDDKVYTLTLEVPEDTK